MQPQQAPPKPLDLQPFLQNLNQKLTNMKRQNAQQLGVLVQAQSEQIGRQHDGLIQEIAPLVQEVGRLQNLVEQLQKQIPQPKELHKDEEAPIPPRDPPKKEGPTLVTKVDPKGK